MAKKKILVLKEYIRKTKVPKEIMLQDFNSFLDRLNNFQKYPVPIYEILIGESNEKLLEYMLDEKQLDINLQNLKTEERKIHSKKSTEEFFYALNENQSLFSFNLSMSTDSYQNYIGKNLRNLISLKFTLSYLNSFELFYNELERKIELEIKGHKEELEELHKSLLNLDINVDLLSIQFSLEKEFNIKDLIVRLDDIGKVKDFKFNLSNYDNSINDRNFISEFISKHIDPRIDLIINSLKEILISKIVQLNNLSSNEVNINTNPYSEYYIFMCETKRLTQHGFWIFEDLIKSEIESKEKTYDTNELAEVNNSPLEEENSSIKQEKEYKIKNVELLSNINKWIQEKKLTNKVSFHHIYDYFNYLFLSHSLNSLDEELYDYIWGLVENVSIDLSALIKLPNFPLIIPKKLKIIEEPEETDLICDLLVKLDKVLIRIQTLLNHNDFYRWFKNEKIIFNYINPWISLINTIIYLESEEPDINDFEIPFWDEMVKIFVQKERILTCDIAENYLGMLYTSYKRSKKIFRYEILMHDIFKIFNNSRDF